MANIKAIVKVSILAAYHKNDWCPDTNMEEVLDSDIKFEGIVATANQLVRECGVKYVVTDYDVAMTIWGRDSEDLESCYEYYEDSEV